MDNLNHRDSKQVFNLQEIIPDKKAVLSSIGIGPGIDIRNDIQFLCDEAMKLFLDLARPAGLQRSIEEKHFGEILKGEGHNEARFPLQDIIIKSDKLALFIFTLGKTLSRKIQQLIHEKDYPLGYMLDTIASHSVDQAVSVQEKRFIKNNSPEAKKKALLYSPGYCGWHISVQRKIFNYLNPEKIGISLNENSLMSPIKSVTGVLVTGNKDIHKFKNNFVFCKDCKTFSCRERV